MSALLKSDAYFSYDREVSVPPVVKHGRRSYERIFSNDFVGQSAADYDACADFEIENRALEAYVRIAAHARSGLETHTSQGVKFPGRIKTGKAYDFYVGDFLGAPVVDYIESLLSRDVKSEFARLADEWMAGTKYTSSTTVQILHPAFQRAIALGPKVLPYMLAHMESTGAPWFAALQALTGENPVQESDLGRPKKMRQAWLSWAEAKGILSS